MNSEILQEIKDLLQQGKTAEARAKFEMLPVTGTVDYRMLQGTIELRFQQWGKAYNAFLKAQQIDPGNVEAKTQIMMIDSILKYRNMDQFNP